GDSDEKRIDDLPVSSDEVDMVNGDGDCENNDTVVAELVADEIVNNEGLNDERNKDRGEAVGDRVMMIDFNEIKMRKGMNYGLLSKYHCDVKCGLDSSMRPKTQKSCDENPIVILKLVGS
ncbi:28168_t:CDS:2, partial [Dentiscutata erythropus]